MNPLLRSLLFVVAFAFCAMGLGLAFTPTRAALEFAVSPTALAGLGTLRADLGGLFLAMGAFTFAGLRGGQSRWLVVPLALVATILALRAGHLAVDGVTPAGVRSTVAEAVLLLLFASGWRRFSRRDRA